MNCEMNVFAIGLPKHGYTQEGDVASNKALVTHDTCSNQTAPLPAMSCLICNYTCTILTNAEHSHQLTDTCCTGGMQQ